MNRTKGKRRKNRKKIDDDELLENEYELRGKKRNKKRRKRQKEETSRTKKKIKLIIFLVIIITIIVFGVRLGISTQRWKMLAQDMMINENSVVKDIEGNTIAELGSEKKKKTIKLSEMPNNLKNAYVAIEDERFYSHGGVDIKRTSAAIASYIFHVGSSNYGGSTITQQLVKNLTGDSTDKITRKVKEWWKASQLESCLSKDEILETYLNVIYVGPNLYGVETGSEYYFSKSAKDLTLEECAFLAGINNSPNSYNPFVEQDNTEKIKKRTKIVLAKMLELQYISNSDYDKAIANVETGIKFKKGEISSNDAVYSYHTDALITEITKDIEEKYNISETFATNYINMAGLTISSTQNSEIQQKAGSEFEKKKYVLPSKNSTNSSQAAMVIIDHKTGFVTACIGGLGKKTEARSLNRATQSVRQTGSAIKPLSVLAPAIDKKIITAASIYNDTERDFADGYHPTDYNSSLGKITIRRAVESSQNIPFVEIMEELKPSKSIKYLKKMGISTLTEEDNNLVLALGGLQNGISPLEMAGAYSTIANDGVYVEPTFYKKIEKKNGELVIESKQKSRKVFSKEVAYILKELLTQPVIGTNGTATYCSISGMDVAAKTGTTDENYDRWLCGFTPYYTAVTWYGYDINESIDYNEQNPAGLIWASVMSNIHSGLASKKFDKPNAITSATICSKTGLKARTGCPNTYEEYFLMFTVPDQCSEHTGSEIKNTNNINKTTKSNNVNKQQTNNNTTTTNVTIQQENIVENSTKNTTNVVVNSVNTTNSNISNDKSNKNTTNNNNLSHNTTTSTNNANTNQSNKNVNNNVTSTNITE